MHIFISILAGSLMFVVGIAWLNAGADHVPGEVYLLGSQALDAAAALGLTVGGFALAVWAALWAE